MMRRLTVGRVLAAASLSGWLILLLARTVTPWPELEARRSFWIDGAAVEVTHSRNVEDRARELLALGFSPLDALHVAYAESAGASVLLTCDDGLISLGRRYQAILRTVIKNPVDAGQEGTR
jgi:predicted nucleic acid-binding protein